MSECRICCGKTKGVENWFEKIPEKKVSQGTVLIKEGVTQDTLYFLCQGKLKIVKDFSGQQFEIATLGPGSLVGEMEFLTGNPPAATVVVLEDSLVHTLAFTEFRKMLEEGCGTAVELLFFIARVLAHRLERMDQKIVELLHENRPVYAQEFTQFRKKLLEEWDF